MGMPRGAAHSAGAWECLEVRAACRWTNAHIGLDGSFRDWRKLVIILADEPGIGDGMAFVGQQRQDCGQEIHARPLLHACPSSERNSSDKTVAKKCMNRESGAGGKRPSMT